MQDTYKLSQRFPHNVKPVHPGVYATIMFKNDDIKQAVLFQGYSRWDGKFWSSAFSTVEIADAVCSAGNFQNKIWWGIVKEESKVLCKEESKVLCKEEQSTVDLLQVYVDGTFNHRHGLCNWLDEAAGEHYFQPYLLSEIISGVNPEFFQGKPYVGGQKGRTPLREKYANLLITYIKTGKVYFENNTWNLSNKD